MLFIVKRCVHRIESHIFKRVLFYSTVSNTECKHNEQISELDKPVPKEHGKKFLKVAILGLPNVGKSTLINQLVNRAVCPTSSKVHTTLNKAEAIYTENDTQIVFMDTPGITTKHEMKKYNLTETFRTDLKLSITEADVIGIMQDMTNIYTRHIIHKFILDYLKQRRENSSLLLIFNKVDKLKKKTVLLDLARQYTENKELPKFDDIFMISALTGDGIDDLRNYLIDSAKEKDWQYEKEKVVDQPMRKLIEEMVRAAAMDFLPQEVPYCIKIRLDHLDVGPDGTLKIVVRIDCSKARYARYLLGHKGKNLKLLAMTAEQNLQHGFRTRVLLLISVDKPIPKSKFPFS